MSGGERDTRVDFLIGAMNAASPVTHHDRRAYSLHLRNTERRLVEAAAKQRGLTMAAFGRRATVAFACYVLGVDYYDAMKGAPKVKTFEQTQERYRRRTGQTDRRSFIEGTEDGKGCGTWRITGTR